MKLIWKFTFSTSNVFIVVLISKDRNEAINQVIEEIKLLQDFPYVILVVGMVRFEWKLESNILNPTSNNFFMWRFVSIKNYPYSSVEFCRFPKPQLFLSLKGLPKHKHFRLLLSRHPHWQCLRRFLPFRALCIVSTEASPLPVVFVLPALCCFLLPPTQKDHHENSWTGIVPQKQQTSWQA